MQFKEFENEAEFLREVELFAESYVRRHASEIDSNETFPDDFTLQLACRRLLALDKLNETAPVLRQKSRYDLLLKALGLLSVVSASVAKAVLDQNFGQIEMFREYATDDLLFKYMPKIKSGESQMAFLMTEPHAGSALSSFRCTAQEVKGGFSLRGHKDWITGGSIRTLYLVVARSQSEPESFGLFFVDRCSDDIKGSISISARKRQLGLRGLGEYRVEFANTFVPHTQVLVPCDGSAVTKIMKHYNLKRCGTAAIAIGLSKAAMHCAYNYLRVRQPGEHGGLAYQNTEFTCAKMYCLILAAEQLNEWAAAQVAAGDGTGVPSSVSKLFATESAVKITNTAIQLCGANATSQEMPLERYMRDARMLTIAGGTSEVLARTIARNLPLQLSGVRFT